MKTFLRLVIVPTHSIDSQHETPQNESQTVCEENSKH